MAKKVLLTWNSHPQHERELFHHVREVMNKASPLGLQMSDAYYTMYGDAPEILLGFVPRKGLEDKLESILSSQEWKEIVDEVKQYITDYQERIIKAADHFQY